MKLLIAIIFCTILFADDFDNIPFDWSGQFGVTKHRGAILWNEDWRSKRLFFDGTWVIYPKMYGPEIEKGFYDYFYDLNVENDSINIDSYFKYDQGDYLLDKFSFAVKYNKDKRNLWFHGFKRTYAGNFNQYSSGSLQPQQQSYIVSYDSKIGEDNAGFSLGHFNTYSGYPDTLQNGLFDSRITNSNIFWKRKSERFTTVLTIDHFLQRYQIIHSLVNLLSPRYLTRNKYEIELSSPILRDNALSLRASINERTIKMDSSIYEQWQNYSIKYGTVQSNILLGIFILGHKPYPQYSLNFEKYFGNITAKIVYGFENKPTHPYFMLNEFEQNIPKNIAHEIISTTLIMNFKKSILSSTASQISNKNKFWDVLENDSSKNILPNRMVAFFYQTNVIPYLNIRFNYKIQNPKAIYSLGIGKAYEMILQSKFKLFNEFMDISLNLDFKHLRDRLNNSYMNLMEMVPIYSSSEKNNILDPVNIINGSISAKVSKITICYNWYNIAEMILDSIQSPKDNLFTFHPNMPYLGRQVNLSIIWMFKN